MTFYDPTDNVTYFSIGFGDDPQNQFGMFAKGYTNAAATLAEDLLARSINPATMTCIPSYFYIVIRSN